MAAGNVYSMASQAAALDIGPPAFEPGKPWQGLKNIEEDPHATPGSISSNLSISRYDVGRRAGLRADRPTNRPTDTQTDQHPGRPTHRPTDRHTDRPTNTMTDTLTDTPTEQPPH